MKVFKGLLNSPSHFVLTEPYTHVFASFRELEGTFSSQHKESLYKVMSLFKNYFPPDITPGTDQHGEWTAAYKILLFQGV